MFSPKPASLRRGGPMFLNQTTKFLAALVQSQKLHVDFSAIADLDKRKRTHGPKLGRPERCKSKPFPFWWLVDTGRVPISCNASIQHYPTLVGLCAGVPCLFLVSLRFQVRLASLPKGCFLGVCSHRRGMKWIELQWLEEEHQYRGHSPKHLYMN